MKQFRFDSVNHEYFLGDSQLPGVTSILKSAGIINTQFYTVAGRDRGTLIHESCEHLDRYEIDLNDLDEEIRPFVQAYKNFKEDTGFAPTMIESPIYHSKLMYAGCLDRVGILNGKNVLIDLKSGVSPKWASLQLIAYKMACEDMFPSLFNEQNLLSRLVLQLKSSGSYKLVEFSSDDDERDWAVFKSACSVNAWKTTMRVK